MENENKGNWWIWKVFWILLILTTVEAPIRGHHSYIGQMSTAN